MALAVSLFVSFIPVTGALHHMKFKLPEHRAELDNTTPLVVTNQCSDTIWPGITTQHGQGPEKGGFKLASGASYNQTVSADWQGRVWGRTNCTFNEDGTGSSSGSGEACGTGDCNGLLSCMATGKTPVSLAEMTLDGGDGQTYYDISLVDGYNLPVAMVLIPGTNESLDDIPPNLTNPSCQGTADLLAAEDYSPYSSPQAFLGTNSTFPLPFDKSMTSDSLSRWCPWDLQLNPPSKPGDGVYPYPDDDIPRPQFQPCYSACAKWNQPQDCCTGDYDTPDSCHPSLYSNAAKGACPDAYSYAYDDQTSTFIIPVGAGFQVVFCPGGRSTNILATKKAALEQLQNTGHTGEMAWHRIAQNLTKFNDAEAMRPTGSSSFALVVLAALFLFSNGLW